MVRMQRIASAGRYRRRSVRSYVPALLLCAIAACFGLAPSSAMAEPSAAAKKARSNSSMFDRNFDVSGFFNEPAQVKRAAPPDKQLAPPNAAPVAGPAATASAPRDDGQQPHRLEPAKPLPSGAVIPSTLQGSVGLDIAKIRERLGLEKGAFPELLPPDQNAVVRVNPDAPSPGIGMVKSLQAGDEELARLYAKQWVRYQQDYFFLFKQLVDLTGQAMIEQGAISDDDWDGVSQYIDYEFATARTESGAVLKPTHQQAMERIKPDIRGEAEVYYFFTLNCSYCRKMATDVERLWRATHRDSKVKMVGLLLGKVPRLWIDEYRTYTGLTIPVFEGRKQAKAFNVAFVPALIVVAPNSKVAYMKTGQQSFERMYEFVRRVQGLPATLTPEVQQAIAEPIGQKEQASVRLPKASPQLREASLSGSVVLPVKSKREAPSALVGRF